MERSCIRTSEEGLLRGGDEKSGQMPRPQSAALFIERTVEWCILMCDFSLRFDETILLFSNTFFKILRSVVCCIKSFLF